jgi:hypothetical protein
VAILQVARGAGVELVVLATHGRVIEPGRSLRTLSSLAGSSRWRSGARGDQTSQNCQPSTIAGNARKA